MFHHSANDCEMRRVPFPNVGKAFGVGAINFTVIYTMVGKLCVPEKSPSFCVQRLYCNPEDT